jgi:hypothetical protein
LARIFWPGPNLSWARFNAGHGSEKAISAAWNRLDIAGRVGIVAERFPHLTDRYSQAVVELDEGVACPEMLPDFIARDNFPVTLNQHHQQTIRQVLQFNAVTVSRKNALAGIKFEWAETIERRAGRSFRQESFPKVTNGSTGDQLIPFAKSMELGRLKG